jgi:hypothetical protein
MDDAGAKVIDLIFGRWRRQILSLLQAPSVRGTAPMHSTSWQGKGDSSK